LVKLNPHVISSDQWNRVEYPYTRTTFGHWELTIPPAPDGTCRIKHNTIIKVRLWAVNNIIFRETKGGVDCGYFKINEKDK